MTHKKPIRVCTVRDLQTIAQYIVDNEDYRQQWIETIKEEGFEYGKQSLYYIARKSLESNLMGFETKMLKELVSELIEQ